ncbi:MAG: hypothetical protein DRI46_06650 [Chloroflexi bacterium]|nr:MAG: hypothetical protein DRI46_06650 [Chloroflexota bacterium]
MYEKIKGGSTFKCQEGTPREVTVFLPPVGKGFFYNLFVDFDTSEISEIKELNDVDILSSSAYDKDQVWERPRPPENYKQDRLDEMGIQAGTPDYFDPELERYREQEWNRRESGVWCMINGKAVYITGAHYMYLAHWRIDIGFPQFREPDLDYFYFLQWNIENPHSRGMIEMTKRRFGKTFRGGLFVYEYTSRNKRAYAGIQSKNAKDAQNKVFGQALVEPFQTLIDFFRPVIDEAQGLRGKNIMRFFQTSRRGKITAERILSNNEETELASWIDPRSQKVSAFDGDKLHRYLRDECFKLEDEDIYESHETIKPCVEIDGRIIGKMLYTSTVEEFNERARVANKMLWDLSSLETINEDSDIKETSTGLVQFFMPDYRTMYFDKFGYPDEKRGRKYFDDKRQQYMKTGNHKGLTSFVRKHPRTPEEAFWSSAGMCIYDEVRIRTTMQNLEPIENDIWKRGELDWIKVDGVKTGKVKWRSKANGPFRIARWPTEEEANNTYKRGGEIFPKNKTQFLVGVDPFDHDLVDMSQLGSRPSDGAAAVYMKNTPGDEDFNNNFVAYYLFRRPKATKFYEDMLKLCIYYGAEMLYESQKPGIKHFFVDQNASGLLMRYDGKKRGVVASKALIETIMEETENFLDDSCERVVFRRLLQDWLDYDPRDTQKYDLAAATGIALIGARKLMRRVVELQKRNTNGVQLVKRYKQTVLN